MQVEKEKTTITIDQIRQINGRLAKPIGINRLVIINDFQSSRIEAQNAFLKTLEEKAGEAFFILVCGRLSAVLPTIISRSRVIKLARQENQPSQLIKTGSLAEMFGQYSGLERKKDKALAICDQLIGSLRNRLVEKPDAVNQLREILKTRNLIETNNLNPQLGVDHLILMIDKTN